MVKYFDKDDAAVDAIIDRVGKKIIFAMPVALGKPNDLLNALFRRAKLDPSIELTILSALVPEKPQWSSDLERRMLEPMHERLWKDWHSHLYWEEIRNNTLPSNIRVLDMYTKAGAILNVPYMQQNYLNFSYTLIIRNMLESGVNVIGSLFAKRVLPSGEVQISGASNTDLFFTMAYEFQRLKKEGKKVVSTGQINKFTPFLYGDDTYNNEELFDILLEGPEYDFPLFFAPKPSVGIVDHMIGLYASTLIKDGGTIQIGIGALADAIVNSILMRHEKNIEYQTVIKELGFIEKFGEIIERIGDVHPFQEGLHANSEMMVEPFLFLAKQGILKRKVYDHWGIQFLVNSRKIIDEDIPKNILELLLEIKGIQSVLTEEDVKALQKFGVLRNDLSYTEYFLKEKGGKQYSTDIRDKVNLKALQKECLGSKLQMGYIINAAFFLGSRDFYNTLLSMEEIERSLIRMNGVMVTNTLYGNEKLRRLQRKGARFINTGMYLTLLGGVCSDQLEDGRIISGVGGQFNFVEMANALEDGRSILICKSTKGSGKHVKSNVRFNYGHITIPRYLKDIVITEYGIADLRIKSDAETIMAILNITDSRFQQQLLDQAKKAKKIPLDYQIPDQYRNNNPESIANKLTEFKKQGFFKVFPFGSDFTQEEVVLSGALKALKTFSMDHKGKLIGVIIKPVKLDIVAKSTPFLKRMALDSPKNVHEKIYQKLVVHGLQLIHALK